MIKFGTSGWRAVMGAEFTFSNVRIVVQAIANYLKRRFAGRTISVVVNYDTRFLSERFANEAAKILSHNQIQVLLSDRDAPSQAQALQVIMRKAQAGINFTASFNPPEYNGLKLNLETGAPALPFETDQVEEEVRRLSKLPAFIPYYPRSEFVQKIDLQSDYLEFIRKKIDFASIRKSEIRVGVDLLYGTSREYLDEILEDNDIPVEEIHGYVDPYFGGITPSCSERNLRELRQLVLEKKCDLGIATDADGDRFGIVDQNGHFVIQNIILALLLDYLVRVKGWRGGVARSVATSHLIDRIARRYGLPLFKTPVGFKYMADLFLRQQIIFGGEESACIAVKSHLPEKDGIFAGLLVAEMMAVCGKNLTGLQQEFYREYGRKFSGQRSLPLQPRSERLLKELLIDPPEQLGGRRVQGVERIDGIKLDFEDDDWLLLRLSGTEPLIRCYAEANSRAELETLLALGMKRMS
ncbi:MAG: phosphoglucomutase/phosphomannomutase family protein [Candidatus Aminicenantales bacterium]